MAKEKYEDWEDRADTKKALEFFESNLDYEKYLVDPKSERVWEDINKDLSLGNIADWEHQAILNQEKTLRGLMGMKEELANKTIAELFVPVGLLKLYQRMPAFTLALSLSKGGFKQNLMRSFTKQQILEAKTGSADIEYNRSWMPKRKKKKQEGEQP